MRRAGIQQQIFLVALIPIIVMTVLLSGYFIYVRFADLEEALLDRSLLIARQLSFSSEYALFSGNAEMLRQGVEDALLQPDVEAVVILDADSRQLAEAGENKGDYANLIAKVNSASSIYQDHETLLLYQPVQATQIKLSDSFFNEKTTPESARPLGAVIVKISKMHTNRHKNELILFTLLAVLLVMTVALVIALWAAYRISKPVLDMRLVVSDIRAGNLAARIQQQSGVHELNELAVGINNMAQQLQDEMGMLEARIEEAVGELREKKEEAERSSADMARLNERLTVQISRMPLAYIVWDRDFRVVEWNASAEKLFGYSAAEAFGRHAYELIVPEGARQVVDTVWEGVARGGNLNSHSINENVTKDGKEIVCEWFNAPLHDVAGNIAGCLSMASDITERRAMEVALQNAKIQAEEASRSKGHFLANMSHEIRTPMNSIIGMAQLALKNEQNPKQRDYLNKIRLSGEHLLGIIDDILDFSKIDAGKLTLENIGFDIGQIRQTLINLVEWKAADKGIKLTFDFDAGIPRNLSGDPLRLNQILINYINNAIKFTHQGEIAVRARKMEESEEDVLLRFEVQDTGIGISEAQKDNLFQAFQQADSSTSRKYGGSGLGLVISRRLAELMGGEVGVESREGQGSTFWATVRIDKCDIPVSPTASEESVEQAAPAIHGIRILLAEDNLFNQQVATEFLQGGGAIVRVVNNGERALDLLRQEPFDCVLMDVQMPVMDGLTATRLLRADATLSGIPVIAMTANASNEKCAKCLEAGMDDFISKPFRQDKLYAIIAKWVQVKPQHESLSHPSREMASTAMTAGGHDDIDFSVMTEWMGGDPKKMREFMARFVDSAEKDVTEIEEAILNKDMAAMSSVGHRASSGARMMGATGFANLCKVLEDCNHIDDLERARGCKKFCVNGH